MSKRRVYLARCTECGLVCAAALAVEPSPSFGLCRDCKDWRAWEWRVESGIDPTVYGLEVGKKEARAPAYWVRVLKYARA